MATNTTVPVPSNPLTIKLNLVVLGFVFDWFAKKFLPAFKPVITSEYRTPDHNSEVGGAVDSAHVYGLARDFVLQYPNGEPVPEIQAKSVFDAYVAPNWPGFSEWAPSSAAQGYHIHVNLAREVSVYAGIAGIALIGVVGFKIISGLGGSKDVN
jgi:hypothetical protein